MTREFEILGKSITFSDKQLEFVRIRSLFEKLKEDVLTDVELDLEAAVSDFSELPTHLARAVADCLSETTDLSVQTLCSYDIYDIDEEAFQDRLVEQANQRQRT